MENGFSASGISRIARSSPRPVPQYDRPSLLSFLAIHRTTDGIDHRRYSSWTSEQMSQSQIFDLGLLHRNAITRFQRSEYLSMQSENALHLPIGSDLSRRFHETNLHVSFIGGNPSNYWFVVDRHRSTLKRRSLHYFRNHWEIQRSRRGSVRNDQHQQNQGANTESSRMFSFLLPLFDLLP